MSLELPCAIKLEKYQLEKNNYNTRQKGKANINKTSLL